MHGRNGRSRFARAVNIFGRLSPDDDAVSKAMLRAHGQFGPVRSFPNWPSATLGAENFPTDGHERLQRRMSELHKLRSSPNEISSPLDCVTAAYPNLPYTRVRARIKATYGKAMHDANTLAAALRQVAVKIFSTVDLGQSDSRPQMPVPRGNAVIGVAELARPRISCHDLPPARDDEG